MDPGLRAPYLLGGLLALVTPLFLLGSLLASGLALLKIFGRPAPAWLTRGVAVAALPVLALWVLQFHLWPGDVGLGDFRVFWNGGRDLLAGRNPFTIIHGGLNPFVHPPSAFPVYAALARLPLQTSGAVWQAVNLLLAAGLVEVARRVYQALCDEPSSALGRADTAELSAAVTLSMNVAACLHNGQLGIFIAFMANLAVLLQARGRPVLAGLALLGVSFKPQTLLPFLILFLNRRALPAWATLAAGSLASTLLFFTPDQLPGLIDSWLRQVRATSAVGSVNDFSSANIHNGSILNFGVALDGLGLRDHGAIALASTALVALIGLALTLEVVVLRRLPATAYVSLVSCYAMLFMYHRGNHDCAALVFPLVHALALSRGWGGRPVRSAQLAACAILLTLHMTGTTQIYLAKVSWSLGALGWLIRALVIPRSVYLLSIVLLFFWIAPRQGDGGRVWNESRA